MTVAMLIALVTSAWCAEITLQWDANTESDLAGYNVWYTDDTEPKKYQETVSPDLTEYTVTNLRSGTEYSFHLTAFDTEALESADSNTVQGTTEAVIIPNDNPIVINTKPATVTVTIKVE